MRRSQETAKENKTASLEMLEKIWGFLGFHDPSEENSKPL
jgi:hypothetical protein